MRNRYFAFYILIFSFIFQSLAFAEYAPGKVIIKFKPGVVSVPKGVRIAGVAAARVRASSVKSLNVKHQVYRIKRLYTRALKLRPDWTFLENNYVLIFPKDKDVEKVAKDYKRDPNVELAAPVSRVKAFVTNPNDPYFVSGDQYGLTNINAPQAWDGTTGSSSITIAVLDTGIDYNHEDFQGRVDLANAYDYVNSDNDPMDDHASSHGTSVAGVIGAVTNNGKGIAGIDWQAKILPLKVLDRLGNGEADNIAEAIVDATALGVDVINMSFGQGGPSANMGAACLTAYNNGVVLVAAAGNDDTESNTYPASYSTVIAVAAVDQNDQRSVWNAGQASNYGAWVDVSAPGSNIWSTIKNNSYNSVNGTSFACPYVAGLAGLVKAASPGLTNQQIMDKISSEADDIDSLNPGYEGKLGKRINAYLAVAGVIAKITSPANGSYIKGAVDIYGSASGWDFTSYLLEALQGGTVVATIESGATSVESGILGTWDTTGFNGEYTIRLKAFSIGSTTEEAEVTAYVDNINPAVDIYYPQNGANIAGSVTILGTAEDQYLDRYVLEYGAGDSPANFETIKQSYISVDGGILGTWETSGLSGQYTIKLTAYDKVGTMAENSILVDLQNTGAVTRGVETQASVPLTYSLPNPFDRSVTSEVTFNYTLEGNFDTKIYLFGLSGELVWQNSYLAGLNGGKSGANNPSWPGTDFSGANVPNGVYLYQIIADQKAIARGKIVILN